MTAATQARGPGRPAGGSADKTREQILAAALEVFARDGLAGSSMRDIARRARLRVSTLYHYVRSKDALYRAVQEHVQGRVRALVMAELAHAPDLAAATRRVVGKVFDLFLENRAFLQLGHRAMLEGAKRPASSPSVAERWLGVVESTLAPAEARGEVKAIDPVHLMVTVDALVHWHILSDAVYRELLGRGLEDPEIAARTREHVVRVALRTLGLD